MISQNTSLGLLLLDDGPPPSDPPGEPLPGTLRDPATLGAPIITEIVQGAWPANVIRGDPALEAAYVRAAKRLTERGAVAISANCGFSIRYQRAVAASVNVPVVMSSLLLLPTLFRQLPTSAKIAVVTIDSKHLGEDLLGIYDPAERARIVIGGLEGGRAWHDMLKCPAEWPGIAIVEAEVTACVEELRAAHPEIAALLFECTAFPLVAPAIRRITKLPIYDITTLCRMTLASIL